MRSLINCSGGDPPKNAPFHCMGHAQSIITWRLIVRFAFVPLTWCESAVFAFHFRRASAQLSCGLAAGGDARLVAPVLSQRERYLFVFIPRGPLLRSRRLLERTSGLTSAAICAPPVPYFPLPICSFIFHHSEFIIFFLPHSKFTRFRWGQKNPGRGYPRLLAMHGINVAESPGRPP